MVAWELELGMTPDERWLKAHHIEPCQIEEPVRREYQAALIAVVQQAAANWCERAREEHLAMERWRPPGGPNFGNNLLDKSRSFR